MKKIVSLLLAVVMLFCLTSCMKAVPKDFTCGDMTITLTDDFKETTHEELELNTVCYEAFDMVVLIQMEPFAYELGLHYMSLEHFTNLVWEENYDKLPSKITVHEKFRSMEYTYLDQEDNQKYKSFVTTFRGAGCFYIIQFISKEKDYESHKDTFLEFANSVTFKQ